MSERGCGAMSEAVGAMNETWGDEQGCWGRGEAEGRGTRLFGRGRLDIKRENNVLRVNTLNLY